MGMIARKMDITGVTEIELHGSGRVVVQQDASETLVTEADEFLMPHVVAEIRGNKLILRRRVRWAPFLFLKALFSGARWTVRYRVAVRRLSGLSLIGSGSIEADDMETDVMNLVISGSGTIRVREINAASLLSVITGSGTIECSGVVEGAAMQISGSGRVKADDLQCQDAMARISGSGDIDVNACHQLSVNITGSGNVHHFGEGKVIKRISGSGKVSIPGGRRLPGSGIDSPPPGLT